MIRSSGKSRRPSPERIVRKPGVCGGSPIIAGTRIPVWGLEEARRKGISNAGILRMYPWLKRADLTAAWEYVAAHPKEIDREIQQNQDA